MGYSHSETEFLRAFGKRVRKLRTAAGYSQEQFAFQCGLHRTYVGALERGERNGALLNLRKIAAALNRSVSNLKEFD